VEDILEQHLQQVQDWFSWPYKYMCNLDPTAKHMIPFGYSIAGREDSSIVQVFRCRTENTHCSCQDWGTTGWRHYPVEDMLEQHLYPPVGKRE
jgi:hypothetical protein